MAVKSVSTADDEAIYLDGGLALREGQETGAGGPWQRFMRVAINDHGDYLVSGEINAVTTAGAISSGTTTSTLIFGRKSTTYSAPR